MDPGPWRKFARAPPYRHRQKGPKPKTLAKKPARENSREFRLGPQRKFARADPAQQPRKRPPSKATQTPESKAAEPWRPEPTAAITKGATAWLKLVQLVSEEVNVHLRFATSRGPRAGLVSTAPVYRDEGSRGVRKPLAPDSDPPAVLSQRDSTTTTASPPAPLPALRGDLPLRV